VLLPPFADEPTAVVDGSNNMVSRYFGIDIPINSSQRDKYILKKFAQSFIARTYYWKYNQAIMDFGSKLIKPQSLVITICH
jgi:adenine-specific DNA glycosylase